MVYRGLEVVAGFIARWMAYMGGMVLIALTLTTCVSILGRFLFQFGIGPGPLKEIFDLTQIGIAAAMFAFFPWCQLARGHATVDLLEGLFGPRLNRSIDLVVDMALLFIAVFGSWRMYLGLLDKKSYYETTFIMQFDVWKAYAMCLVGMIAFAIVAAFCVLRSARALTNPALQSGELR